MIKLNKNNQKILITGETRFIGSKLVEEFLKDGHQSRYKFQLPTLKQAILESL